MSLSCIDISHNYQSSKSDTWHNTKYRFSVLNKHLLTTKLCVLQTYLLMQRTQNNKSNFSAGRFLRRYSFIYLLQFSIPIRYYAMAIQYMNLKSATFLPSSLPIKKSEEKWGEITIEGENTPLPNNTRRPTTVTITTRSRRGK